MHGSTRRGALSVSLTRRKIRAIAIIVAVLGLAIAAFVAVRLMDFSFLDGLSARSLVYIVPLFLVYQIGAVLAYGLLLRTMGYHVGVARLTGIVFASYASNLTGVPRTAAWARGVPASTGRSASALLYSVELAITILIAVAGLSYFVPERTFRNIAWLVVAIALIAALAILFHVSRRKELRSFRFGQRLTDFLTETRDGMRQTTGTTLVAIVGLALAKRFILACTSYLVLNDLGNPVGIGAILLLQSSAILVGFVSMIPLGIGTRDLTTFFLYLRLGLPPEVAVAMAAIERVLWTLVPFCLGLACTGLTGAPRQIFPGP